MPKEVSKHKAAPVFVLKMTPELADRMKHKGLGHARLPRKFDPGTRLLLREYHGGNTGRADLCEVIGYTETGVATLRRAWCWHTNAPDDLTCLSYALSDEAFPVRLEAEAA